MDSSYPPSATLWGLAEPNDFSQLPDDDFLALLQKQFPSADYVNLAGLGHDGLYSNSIDPQSISNYTLPDLSPPSDDSSPSPPSAGPDSSASATTSRRQSAGLENGAEDSALKRKASDDSLDDGPNKNQHTGNGKRGSSARRKSSGGQDESRLMKRKEQNRAAQRAFRERKERHVKDLEDKVAALEAKNNQTTSENENLRDLLSRLQNENVALKQSSFSFSVPKPSDNPQSQTDNTPMSLFSPPKSPTPSAPSHSMDWNSLTAFDASVLSLLDENPQETATDGAMNMDFPEFSNTMKTPYTTLASNPMFMSFADFSPVGDFSNPSSISGSSHNTAASSSGGSDLDGMFGGDFLGNQGLVDFSAYMKSPSSTSALSPISHASARSPNAGSSSSSSPSAASGSGSSSSSSTQATTPSSHDGSKCPSNKEELSQAIVTEGDSPFAPAIKQVPNPTLRKKMDQVTGAMVMCEGGSLPKTVASDKNVEVLSAWRSITSNPRFKDYDINELCSEFTSKARCDGTKVVLEPSGVHHILNSLSGKQRAQLQQQQQQQQQ
ncbi:hypothetical protein PLICRDRAFT_50045 [Plicaturopsis crispa FD-325 SS-3]|nr:hypothetical protein PLICRDRAFT_50045 [Plicaturopsis crispa FD-325 SS-3]